MDSLDEAFGTLADTDMWEQAAATLAGFLAPTVVANVTEGRTSFDVPDEAYGVAIVFLANYSPMYAREMQVGGGIYTVDALLTRFGLKNTIVQMGAN